MQAGRNQNEKSAARIRAAPHLSLVPERLQLALPAPSVAGDTGALQICLCLWFFEPERLRVLRLRRCQHCNDDASDTLSHSDERQSGLCRK